MKGKLPAILSRRALLALTGMVVAVGIVAAGAACVPSAPPPPTAKPAAAPTSAPAAPPKAAAPTTAPAAPTTAPTAVPAKKVTFPESGKAITVIVPYAAGASLDGSSRALAPGVGKELNTTVQVVNKEGAGSQVGMTELAQAKPDGYTIGAVGMPTFLPTYLDPARKAVYTRASFATIANFTWDPYVMAVKADGPYKSVKDLVDGAKANPEKVTIGIGGGAMSMIHLSILALEKAANVKFRLVIFDGGGGASATALLGGHVDAAVSSGSPYQPGAKAGTLKMVGLMDNQEDPYYPGVPTLQSLGYNVAGGAVYQAWIAPAGTPKEIIDLIAKAIEKTENTAEYKAVIDKVGLMARYMTPEQLSSAWTKWEADMKPLIEMAKAQQTK